MSLPKFNIQSPAHLSLLLFGGWIEVDQIEFVLDEDGKPVYIKSGTKKGEIKLKKVKKLVRVEGLGLNPDKNWKTKKPGIYQTNTKILNLIAGTEDED